MAATWNDGTGSRAEYSHTTVQYDFSQKCNVVIIWNRDGRGRGVRIDGKPFRPDSTEDE